MTRSIEEILSRFPKPRNGKEKEQNLADYFHAKNTSHKHEASDTVGIAHQTATQFEETYEDLTEEEKKKLDIKLMEVRLKGPEGTDGIQLEQLEQAEPIEN